MAMIKTVSPSGWDWDRPVAVPLRLSSRGLAGNDRREFLKSASALFLPEVDRLRDELGKHAGDYEPIHELALGATEGYGANRNGDGFREQVCMRKHATFVSLARSFRNHRNKDDAPHYGVVKASAYNPEMRRVELLTFLFKSAKAAERHGGYVADRELEKLARGEDLDRSMAGRVPFDKCSWCRNEARTRDDYCTADTCAAGGCSDNLAKIVKIGGDLHHLHVDNPDVDWFDISTVHRRADRIAQAAGADYLHKAASDRGFMGVDSARIARELGLSTPLRVALATGDESGARLKLAYALAAVERRGLDGPALLGVHPGLRRPADATPFAAGKGAACLAALADAGGVLPLDEYARLHGREKDAADAAALLPGYFGRAVESGEVESLASASRATWPDGHPGEPARAWAARHKAAYDLSADAVEGRAVVASLRGLSAALASGEKRAASAGGRALAADYAAYQLAALERIAQSKRNLALTSVFAVHQNYVSDPGRARA